MGNRGYHWLSSTVPRLHGQCWYYIDEVGQKRRESGSSTVRVSP